MGEAVPQEKTITFIMQNSHYTFSIIPRTLVFHRPAGTSRGVMHSHTVWYVVLTNAAGQSGIGECAPLPGLSCDALPPKEYEAALHHACTTLAHTGQLPLMALEKTPSILFGLETALQHLQAGSFALWPTAFARGDAGIAINGLVWMGDYAFMLQQIEAKLAQGFRCIKLKIGALDFSRELALLRHIRAAFSPSDITIRVDANGAFSPAEAQEKLNRLAEFHLHSIEQPIAKGQWEALATLTANTPLPIALDEELIGVTTLAEKELLLRTVAPQYLVLKPSLHGGLHGTRQWLDLAGEHGVGWWLTSALESNIGLNAVAQWCATLEPTLPQGLGTGLLYTNNLPFSLAVQQDTLWFSPTNMHRICPHNTPNALQQLLQQ